MNDSSTTLDAAQHYISLGWHPLALYGVVDGICTCDKGPECRSAGKHPIAAKWQDQPAPDLTPWGRRRQPTNVGLATGRSFWVLDIDSVEGMAQLQQLGELTRSYTVRTGSGAWQIYYLIPDDFVPTNRDKTLPKGIDVRGIGGQVVAPPSISGKGPYSVHLDVPIAAAPQWLVSLLRPSTPTAAPVLSAGAPSALDRPATRREVALERAVVDGELARLADLEQPWVEGARWDATCHEVACQLIELANAPWTSLSIEQAYASFIDAAPRDQAWDGAGEKWASAMRSVGEKARVSPSEADYDNAFSPDYHGGLTAPAPGAVPAPAPADGWPMRSWDDQGNAQRLVDHFGKTLRWIDEAGRWAVYAQGRWTIGASTVGMAHAQSMLDLLEQTEGMSYSESFDSDEEKMSPRDAFVGYVKKQRMASRLSAMIDLAKARPEFAGTIGEFDQWPDVLNVANGIVDLRTGALMPHDPAAMMRHISPVAFDPDAQCPQWDAFLRRVIPHRDMRDFLQRIVGYSLTGLTSAQAMFIHHGSGANGKSVFLMIMAAVVGDYGQVVPRETLLTKGSGGEHPTAIARMVGRRFLQASETAAGRRMDEEIVKGLTGGEQQTARYMGKDFFDFSPTGKIHFVTNHLPRLTDAESIWRRMHLVRWGVTIPEEERTPDLAQKIIDAEGPGVLAWAVRGAQAWYDQGLGSPGVAKGDLAEYRKDQDEFGRFLFETIDTASGQLVARDTLYGLYQAWSSRNNSRAMQAADFTRAMRERGYDSILQGRMASYTNIQLNLVLAPVAGGL